MVGVCKRGRSFECALKALIHSSYFSGSIITPRSPSILGRGPALLVLPEMLKQAWLEPRLPSQLMASLVKVPLWIVASLYQARLIVESLSCSAPLYVILPGVLAKVRRLDTAHSSTWPVQCDQRIPRGNQNGECVLKSPTIRVDVMMSMSVLRRAFSPVSL